MSSVGIEEAATIGAEHLDRDLRGDRPHRNGLLGAFQGGCFHIRTERLWHALPDQEQGIRNADGEKDVERASGDIDPEVPDGSGGVTRKAARQRNREYDS